MLEDKRTTYIEFYGKKYPLCLTVSAQERIKEEYGSVQELLSGIRKGGPTLGSLYTGLFYHLMLGGHDRARSMALMTGGECMAPDVPSREVLAGIMTSADINENQEAIFSAIKASSRPTVETEEDKGKNGNATQG